MGQGNTEKSKTELIAYVDGSYNIDTKEYGCGVVILDGEHEICLRKKGEDADLASMRNVAGEILGAQIAMERAMELGATNLKLYYDYNGIHFWCSGEWKAKKRGTQEYKAYYDRIKDKLNVEFIKVKGHSGDKYNDMADELAKESVLVE